MNIQPIESMMSTVSTFLMTPVILAIVLLLIYSVFTLGRFLSQFVVRKKNYLIYFKQIKQQNRQLLSGYPIHNYFINNPNACEDELEIFALKKLETLRCVLLRVLRQC
jgi:hypothetical protein